MIGRLQTIALVILGILIGIGVANVNLSQRILLFLPVGWQFSIIAVIFLGIAIIALKQVGKYYQDTERGLPDWWVDSAAMSVLTFVFGGVAGFGIIYISSRVDIYFDNGTDKSVIVAVEKVGEFVIPAHTFTEVEVPETQLAISVDGKSHTYTLSDNRKRVFNLHSKHVYYEELVTYGDDTTGTKNELRLIKDEFFPTKATYMFEAPEVIVIEDKEKRKSKQVLVLRRLTDVLTSRAVGLPASPSGQ